MFVTASTVKRSLLFAIAVAGPWHLAKRWPLVRSEPQRRNHRSGRLLVASLPWDPRPCWRVDSMAPDAVVNPLQTEYSRQDRLRAMLLVQPQRSPQTFRPIRNSTFDPYAQCGQGQDPRARARDAPSAQGRP